MYAVGFDIIFLSKILICFNYQTNQKAILHDDNRHVSQFINLSNDSGGIYKRYARSGILFSLIIVKKMYQKFCKPINFLKLFQQLRLI
jgi:hypothetical protein